MRLALLLGVLSSAVGLGGAPGAGVTLSPQFPLFDAGERVDGLPLTAVLRRTDSAEHVSSVYGDCTPAADVGRYTVADLPAGDYTVSFAKEGFVTQTLHVTLDVGQSVTVNVPFGKSAAAGCGGGFGGSFLAPIAALSFSRWNFSLSK